MRQKLPIHSGQVPSLQELAWEPEILHLMEITDILGMTLKPLGTSNTKQSYCIRGARHLEELQE
jgi:hypothetical protein